MIKKIPFRFATKTMFFLCIAVIFFHASVLIGFVPYSIVWGGRIENKSQMVIFELISISIIIFILLIIGIKAGSVKPLLPEKFVNFTIYSLSILFALNTIGNIFSLSTIEAILFTPVTLLACIFCFRIASE